MNGPADDPASRLIVALDVPGREQAERLTGLLGDQVSFYKIGLELFAAGEGAALARALAAAGKRVFVDLKIFDVPATAGRTMARIADLGAAFASVHGNDAILEAAVANSGDVGILAVTALTSLDRGDLDSLGFRCDPEELTLSRAKRALAIGCRGVVSSGLEVPRLRAAVGDALTVVTPGVRPVDNRGTDDQKRVASAESAIRSGADYVVVGRPVRDAPDPAKAAATLIEEIRRGLESR